jgi:hypothetical protein
MQREDIEPCGVGLINISTWCHLESRRKMLHSLVIALFHGAMMIFTATIVDVFLRLSYGSAEMTCKSIIDYNQDDSRASFGSAVLLYYVAAAISDVGETVSAYPSLATRSCSCHVKQQASSCRPR